MPAPFFFQSSIRTGYPEWSFLGGAVGFSPRNRSGVQVPFRAGLSFRSKTAWALKSYFLKHWIQLGISMVIML